MKAIIQKSGPAKVMVDNETIGEITKGLVVLLGITHSDTDKDIDYLVNKIINLRIFEEDDRHMEKSLLETTKEILLISQFTLYANCNKGRRPAFIDAAPPEIAEPIYEKFIEKLQQQGINVQTGKFGAMMKVGLTNEGPVTIILDSK